MTYQSGITSVGFPEHTYLEFQLRPQADPQQAVAALAAAVNMPTTAGVTLVVGLRPSLWAQVASAAAVPAAVGDFQEPIAGEAGFSFNPTQQDAWLWVQAASRTATWAAAEYLIKELGDYFERSSRLSAWSDLNSRDLTGFEDGTENPGLLEAPQVVAVPAGQPGAGASVLLYQVWTHHVAAWEELDTAAQEAVIGRTKADSVELAESDMPASSHVERTVIERDGTELEIFRRNTAFATDSTHGTVFVGFSQEQQIMEQMLRRMAGADGGPRDALTYFTTPLRSAWYVCPAVADLTALLPQD